MMPPTSIDGTDITGATIDGTDVTEITVDGDTVFTAGPDIRDVGMFQNPIYQWWGENIDAVDGASPVDWPESLAALADASAVNGPTKQTKSGFESVLYNGTSDGHNFTPDAQWPSGGQPHSIAALIYINDTSDYNTVASWGTSSTSRGMYFTVHDSKVSYGIWAKPDAQGGTVPTGQWITVGAAAQVDSQEVYLNGSFVGSESEFIDFPNQNHSIGYRRINNQMHMDGYIAEVVISDKFENAQSFSNYHQNRL